ncbi:MAG: response regulator [Desulfobacterales bacterium]|jgi:two-component system chemotaxis response regulator CheY|nr:response regulator [Desulfobacterales bacterium]
MTKTKKIRAIVADDESHVRKLIKTVLTTMNCEVVGEASNGRDAVELFKTLKPNIMMLDINMPLKSGKEALAEILQRYSNAFVIMMTSLSDKETIEDCINLGASGFIRKDIEIDEMREIIRKTWQAYRDTFKP